MKPHTVAVVVVWLAAGLLIGVGLVSLASIGFFVLPLGLLLLVVAVRLGGRNGWPFVLPGVAGALLWVAWVNRGGPGRHCWEAGCVERLSPLPWLAGGLLLLLLFGVATVTSRQRRGP